MKNKKKLSRHPFIRPSRKDGSVYTWECEGQEVHADHAGESVWVTRGGEVVTTVSSDQAFIMGERIAGSNPQGSPEKMFGQVLSSAATMGNKSN